MSAEYIEDTGSGSFTQQIDTAIIRAPKIAEAMLTAGASVLADGVRQQLTARYSESWYQLPSSFGITPIQRDKYGNYNRRVGFGGYQYFIRRPDGREYAYKNRKAFQLIANVIEYGAVYPKRKGFTLKARPFFAPVLRANKTRIESAMESAAEAEYEKITKGI